ncbi:MAG: InlB B-repeat-containing protein, partial [Eubacteriales bacterium]|nr:InlB B-repeat-containing protein [Eubacteriales bacterium]
MKRVLSAFLISAMFILTVVSAAADGMPTISVSHGEAVPQIIVSDATAAPDDTVTLNVSLVNNPGIAGMILSFLYDENVFESVVISEAEDSGIKGWVTETKAVWGDIRSGNNSSNGNILTVTMKLKDDAAFGTYPVAVSYIPGDICNVDMEDVDFDCVAGVVTVIASGECGENTTWTLDRNGVLTVTGTGICNYPSLNAPWVKYGSLIKELVLDGVIDIGLGAFYSCTGLTSLILPETVVSIGINAFSDCTGLTEVKLPNSLTFMGAGAFGGCTGLTDVYFDGTQAQWDAITVEEGNECLADITFLKTSDFTVTFDANGGKSAPAEQTVSSGETLVLSDEPTYEGYTFLGWATDPEATAAEFSVGESLTVTDNMTLYAVWKINKYHITYDLNCENGENCPAVKSGLYDSEITLSGLT